MKPISDEHLKETVGLLEVASKYFEYNPTGLVIACSACATPPGLPSVQEAFDTFEGLPQDHPLKKEHDPAKVRAGYAMLEQLDFNPDRNYEELRNHLTPP